MKKKTLFLMLVLTSVYSTVYAACGDRVWGYTTGESLVWSSGSSADSDNDSIPNYTDNCPDTCNSEQLDADSDGTGDVCDETPGCGGCGQPTCEKSCELIDKVEELLTHYYWNILGRTPDSGGLNYWTNEILTLVSSGGDIKEGFISFAQTFFNSQEYLYRDRDDEEFVTDLYNTFFNRPPDSGGLNHWTNELAQGMSRSDVLDSFVHSTEFNDFMNELFGIDDECAPGCPDIWIGDGECDTECDVASCSYDDGDCNECVPGCYDNWIGDGECDSQCDVAACSYDGGDCNECVPGCYNNWIGDGFCDDVCNVAACTYDAGDCEGELLCAPGCYDDWIGDGWCDSECYFAACSYDEGDCIGWCAPGCYDGWIGNGHCNAACNVAACNFDEGDC